MQTGGCAGLPEAAAIAARGEFDLPLQFFRVGQILDAGAGLQLPKEPVCCLSRGLRGALVTQQRCDIRADFAQGALSGGWRSATRRATNWPSFNSITSLL